MALTAMSWGATGGIGRALVAELVDQNWTVVAVGRHTGSQPSDIAASSCWHWTLELSKYRWLPQQK